MATRRKAAARKAKRATRGVRAGGNATGDVRPQPRTVGTLLDLVAALPPTERERARLALVAFLSFPPGETMSTWRSDFDFHDVATRMGVSLSGARRAVAALRTAAYAGPWGRSAAGVRPGGVLGFLAGCSAAFRALTS